MSVLQYPQAIRLRYGQASVFLDACFLLVFSDASDPRNMSVEKLVLHWAGNGIKKVGISSHVYGEVVHNLFKRQIMEALYLAGEELLYGRKLSAEQQLQRGDLELADQMVALVGVSKVRALVRHVRSGRPVSRFHVNVPRLIKQIKEDPMYVTRYRRSLSGHYEWTKNVFPNVVHTLTAMGIDVQWETFLPEKDRPDVEFILSSYQLDVHDAIHFAISKNRGYQYLATLDKDYLLSSYVPNLRATRIIHIV